MKFLITALTSLWQKNRGYQGFVSSYQGFLPSRSTTLFLPRKIPIAEVQQGCAQGLQRMAVQADRINQLSRQLEAAMAEMKTIASEVNQDWRSLQLITNPNQIPQNICNYQVREVPWVKRHSHGFYLTSRPVDLFKAEREAASIAQTLRHRSRRKVKALPYQ
jgi:hypothetical protein